MQRKNPTKNPETYRKLHANVLTTWHSFSSDVYDCITFLLSRHLWNWWYQFPVFRKLIHNWITLQTLWSGAIIRKTKHSPGHRKIPKIANHWHDCITFLFFRHLWTWRYHFPIIMNLIKNWITLETLWSRTWICKTRQNPEPRNIPKFAGLCYMYNSITLHFVRHP